MADQDKRWTLHIGCHRKTKLLLSRDSLTEKHDSLEACRQAVEERERFWRTVGYSVWFADAIGPDGEKVELRAGIP